MYFVPLISPEPVTVSQSSGNTQRMRLISVTRQFAADSFSVAGEFEVTGEGSHRNTFDPAENVRRNERKLKDGGSLERALHYISIEGAGWGRIEVDGVVSNRFATVTEVRLQFNARGHHSPVTIGLHDLHLVDGAVRADNAVVARVNTLTFQRTAGRAKMAVSLASVNRENAKDSLWQTLKGAGQPLHQTNLRGADRQRRHSRLRAVARGGGTGVHVPKRAESAGHARASPLAIHSRAARERRFDSAD
jgi:hypothetical protein